jgi:hypothetical protein
MDGPQSNTIIRIKIVIIQMIKNFLIDKTFWIRKATTPQNNKLVIMKIKEFVISPLRGIKKIIKKVIINIIQIIKSFFMK